MYDKVFLAPYLDALVLTGKPGEGREAVAALLARGPADSFLAVRLAEFYRLEGERRKAVALLEESPDHGEKAEVYYRLKAYRKSAQLYADILAEDPTNVPAFIGMIRGLSASGEREAARRELMAFFDAAPSEARPALAIALGAVGDGTPRYYYILADLYRAVVGERPDDVDLKIAQLNLSARRGRYAEAAAGYRSLIEERPYNPLLRLRLARLLSATRDRPRPETVSAYDDYLGIKPYDLDAWREKARFYGWVFDRARARAEYERIVELYPDHVESALEKQAQEAFWRGRHRLAHQRYSDLLELEPDNTHALFLLGQISSLGSRPAEAQAYYRRLLAQAPGHRAATTALGLSERSQRLRLPMSAGYVRQKGFDDRKLITYQPIGVNGDFALSGTVSARAGYQKVRFDFDEAGSFTSDIGRFHLGYAASHFLQLDGFLATLRNDEINQDNLNFGARLSYEWLSGTRTRFEFSRRDLWENRQTVVTSIHVDKFAATVRHQITERIDLGLSGDYARYSDDNERINAELSASYKLFLFPRVLRLVYNYNGFGFRRESVYFSPDRYATNNVAVEFRHFLGFPSGGQYFSEAPRSVYSLYYAVSRDRDNNTFHEGTATLSYGLTRALSLGGVARIIRSDVFREDNFSVFVQSYF